MSNSETVVEASRRFLRILDEYVVKMPRDRKFTFGDRIINRGIDLLETVVDAYYSPRNLKHQKIAAANIHCEMLRQLLRMLYEQGVHDLKKHEHFTRELDAIGKSLGGWSKSIGSSADI